LDCLGSSARSFLTENRLNNIEKNIHNYINAKNYSEAVYYLVKEVIDYLGVVPEDEDEDVPKKEDKEEEEGVGILLATGIILSLSLLLLFF
jgi:hypothetical protein